MSRFVLVHGSWHGGWVWDRVRRLLVEAGHDVEAPDLPGRGPDSRPSADVTLNDHVSHMREVIESTTTPVILVGHSFGGFVISHVAETIPERIELLVYLGAFLLQEGQSVLDVALSMPPAVPHLDIRESEGLVAVKPERAQEVFYDDCSPEDAAQAVARLVAEALGPRRTPTVITHDRFGGVPRVYIETTRDKALPSSLQKQMHAALPCSKVSTLESGHSPFLSMPKALADELDLLASQDWERGDG